MTSLPDSARAVLESPALAHLVTLNPDGSPQVSIVWVGLDGDEIVAGHLPEHRKVRNIRNDSRVALSIETGQRNAIGLNEYLVIYGTARITEGGACHHLVEGLHGHDRCLVEPGRRLTILKLRAMTANGDFNWYRRFHPRRTRANPPHPQQRKRHPCRLISSLRKSDTHRVQQP
jgi:PPOX class probable F420-dependent enzyme